MAGGTEASRGGRQGRRASGRGRSGRLNRERVPASALEIADQDGLSGLSMRRLGAELGVEAFCLEPEPEPEPELEPELGMRRGWGRVRRRVRAGAA